MSRHIDNAVQNYSDWQESIFPRKNQPLQNQTKTALITESRMYVGAGSRNRTDTPFQARDFESRASTNFAIPATQLRIIYDLAHSGN
jgi:hypothetical protein